MNNSDQASLKCRLSTTDHNSVVCQYTPQASVHRLQTRKYSTVLVIVFTSLQTTHSLRNSPTLPVDSITAVDDNVILFLLKYLYKVKGAIKVWWAETKICVLHRNKIHAWDRGESATRLTAEFGVVKVKLTEIERLKLDCFALRIADTVDNKEIQMWQFLEWGN